MYVNKHVHVTVHPYIPVTRAAGHTIEHIYTLVPADVHVESKANRCSHSKDMTIKMTKAWRMCFDLFGFVLFAFWSVASAPPFWEAVRHACSGARVP